MKKLNIKKTKIWQIEGEKVEVATDFLFLGSKITVDDDYSHEKEGDCFLAGKR